MTKPIKPYDTLIVLHLTLIFQRIVPHLQNKTYMYRNNIIIMEIGCMIALRHFLKL